MGDGGGSRDGRGTQRESTSGGPSGSLTCAAIIGYGDEARTQAMRLRDVGWAVDVTMRPGGMSWIRAVADGFRPVSAAHAASRSEVVVVHLPESEQPAVWAYALEPSLRPGTLVVFAHGSALYSGAIDPAPNLDVVLLTSETRGDAERAARVRVAVHRDASGRALERTMSFARAVYGAPRIGTTTVDVEARAELSELVARKGGLTALLAEWDRVLDNPGHEPDEGTLTYYERLRATVVAGHAPGIARPPSSGTELSERPRWRVSRKRGAA
jgi:ketol-acid reductoisomerase